MFNLNTSQEIAIAMTAYTLVRRYRPSIPMKWAPYLFQEKAALLEQMLNNFIEVGYSPKQPSKRRLLPQSVEALGAPVPHFGPMNILFESGGAGESRT